MTPTAIEYRDLHPMPQLTDTATLTIFLIICAALLLAVIGLIVLLMCVRRGRPRRTHAPGAHSGANSRNVWHKRIDSIVALHAQGSITRDEAFDELAQVARDYASAASGTDMRTQTLLELNRQSRSSVDRQGLDLLRQTIEALYPPQFADAALNAQARGTGVEQAGEWVSRLVERWRR
ncbi:MAG: hypothetical protein LKF99_05530 [Bifidobacterium sp.]|jgi:hypothetical protein|nr:hypothetical protein [Bifidobacterium sp.]